MTYDFGFEPANEAHAIVSVVMSIQFAGPLNPDQWMELRAAAIPLAKELGYAAPQPFYAMNITVEDNRIATTIGGNVANSMEHQGMSFGRLDENDRFFDRITFARDAIVLQSNVYIRWQPLFERISKIVHRLFALYDRSSPVVNIKLEYVDRFDIKSGSGVVELLRDNSQYLPVGIRENVHPWHVNMGRYVQPTHAKRRLELVKVQFGTFATRDGSLAKAVGITTTLQDEFFDDGGNLIVGAVSPSDALSVLQAQHDELKLCLARIISDAASSKIGLI